MENSHHFSPIFKVGVQGRGGEGTPRRAEYSNAHWRQHPADAPEISAGPPVFAMVGTGADGEVKTFSAVGKAQKHVAGRQGDGFLHHFCCTIGHKILYLPL